MKTKKTLLIAQEYPLPEDHGSSIRTMNFVRFFKKYGPVDIVYTYKHSGNQTKHSIFSNVFYLEGRSITKSFKRRFITGLIKGIPIPVHDYDKETNRVFANLINDNDYDYIIVRYIINTSLVFNLKAKYKVRTIVDFDDIISGSLYESEYGSRKGWIKKAAYNLNRKLLINYERKCLNFGASLFCSEKDIASLVQERRRNSTFVVPNIYANESFVTYNFEDGFKKKHTLLFIGTLGYKPNSDGLKWFIKTVFPDFKKKYSDAKLIVVGRSPHEDLKELCSKRKGIELYSDVPDVKKYYKQCRAVIVPLFDGGGTRIKILEAALAGRPVLSTPKGAEGLDLANGTEVLLFNNSNEFCSGYSMLSDEDKYNLLLKNAKECIQDRFSENTFNYVMEKVLKYLTLNHR